MTYNPYGSYSDQLCYYIRITLLWRHFFMKRLGRHVNVVLFCGGRGSTTIIQELLRRANVRLTLIVNAYDDGLSTGALRGFITEMLGPSDFRKNLSYLLDPHSKKQYALKKLLEFRFPAHQIEIDDFLHFIRVGKKTASTQMIFQLFKEIEDSLASRIKRYLLIFFDYAKTQKEAFDFSDCSLGNLIFAGAYLSSDKNFNVAAKELSQLVRSRALLVNVSCSENRMLVGLKENGEFLKNEVSIVSEQSPVPIRNIFLVKKSVSLASSASVDEKEIQLQHQEALPDISPEAALAIEEADIILYGPGTQHSSLFPSYRIAHQQLKHSSATIKALVMNLEPDHDIQGLSSSDVIDRALFYLNDSENTCRSITHVLLNDEYRLPIGKIKSAEAYKNITVIEKSFVNEANQKCHNGRAVVETTLSLLEKTVGDQSKVNIFIDIHKRSLAADALCEEFLEMDWKDHFFDATLIFNESSGESIKIPDFSNIQRTHCTGRFPEVDYFSRWLYQDNAEYLVLLTGDGEYRFRDVMLSLRLLEQSNFAAVFGSRTQSRRQFKMAMQAAYGENTVLGWMSACAARLMSMIYMLRFGVVFSDPLTGFRIFKRSRLLALMPHKAIKEAKTPVAIAKCLIDNKLEIAELPVNYRTFSGFADSHWRMKRGIKNLLSLLV